MWFSTNVLTGWQDVTTRVAVSVFLNQCDSRVILCKNIPVIFFLCRLFYPAFGALLKTCVSLCLGREAALEEIAEGIFLMECILRPAARLRHS